MLQALEIHQSGVLREVPMERHVTELVRLAEHKRFKALREALRHISRDGQLR